MPNPYLNKDCDIRNHFKTSHLLWILNKSRYRRNAFKRVPELIEQLWQCISCMKFCNSFYKVVPPPSDMRDAAAAAAVGTTPVEMPGFDKWSSLRN